MNDETLIKMIEDRLFDKVNLLNVSIYMNNDIGCLDITFILVDKETDRQKTIKIFYEEYARLDDIHRAMKCYNKIIEGIKLLVNARYGAKEAN